MFNELPTPGPGIYRMKALSHLPAPNSAFVRAVMFSPANPDLGTAETAGLREYFVKAAFAHLDGEEIVAFAIEPGSGATVTIDGKVWEVALEELPVIPPPPGWTGFPSGAVVQVMGPSSGSGVGRIGWDLPRLTAQG